MRAVGARTHIWNNGLKSAFLLAMFPIFVMLVVYAGMVLQVGFEGHAVAEGLAEAARRLPAAAPWALLGVAAWFAIAFFFNVKLIGAATGARPVTRKQEPALYNLVENLCISKGMRMPALRIIETDAINAYASGVTKDQYTVAVTRGLLETLDTEEVEAVVAHELAHIRHGDVRLMVVASVFVGIVALVAEMAFRNGDVIARMLASSSSSRRKSDSKAGGAIIVFILIAIAILAIARLLSFLTQMALSRTREYMADMEATLLTRNPDAMVSALLKISGKSEIEGVPNEVRSMFFDNASSFLGGMFSTHPSIENRVKALRDHGGASLPSDRSPKRADGPWDRHGNSAKAIG